MKSRKGMARIAFGSVGITLILASCTADLGWEEEGTMNPYASPAAATTFYVGSDAVATFGNAAQCDTTDPSYDGDCGVGSIAALNTAFDSMTVPVGSDVYFKRGETFTFTNSDRFIVIRHSGTSGNWAIFGAYGSGANPIIDAEWLYPADRVGGVWVNGVDGCKDADGNWVTGKKGQSEACKRNILVITDKDYIKLENIDFVNIVGDGPRFNDGCTNIHVDGIKIDRIWGAPFFFSGSAGLIFENSEVSRSQRWREYLPKPHRLRQGGVTVSVSSDAIVRNNYIHNMLGEGLDIIKGTNDFEVSNNIFEDTNSATIAVQYSWNGVVKNNILVRTASSTFGTTRAITVGNEREERNPAWYPYDIVVMGNIIYGYLTGIHIFNRNAINDDLVNLDIVNNTMIACNRPINIGLNSTSDMTGSVISGNIFDYIDTPLDGNISTAVANGLQFLGNHYSSGTNTPAIADIPAVARHAKDIRNTLPTFISATDAQNFSVWTGANPAWASHARPRNKSTAIDSDINNSAYGTELFAPSDTDPRTASMSTVDVWDFGAVDWGGTDVLACKRTGCSGQVCSDTEVFTTCEYLPHYACYDLATCGVISVVGRCGWITNAAFDECMARSLSN